MDDNSPEIQENVPEEQQPNFFTFNLQVPVFITQDEELGQMPLEPYLQKLINDGYATEKEIISYIKLVSHISGSATFLLDEFIKNYRQATGEGPEKKVDLWTPPR